jgi:hypothetical protein
MHVRMCVCICVFVCMYYIHVYVLFLHCLYSHYKTTMINHWIRLWMRNFARMLIDWEVRNYSSNGNWQGNTNLLARELVRGTHFPPKSMSTNRLRHVADTTSPLYEHTWAADTSCKAGVIGQRAQEHNFSLSPFAHSHGRRVTTRPQKTKAPALSHV